MRSILDEICTPVSPVSMPKTSPKFFQRRRFFSGSLAAGWVLLGGGGLLGCASAPSRLPREPGVLGPFSEEDADGSFPEGWDNYIIRRNLKRTQYQKVTLDGRTVLHAKAEAASSGLRCNVSVDPLATPWFSWTWRVDALHLNATVADDDAEDTPVRIILAFEGDVNSLPLRDRMFFEQVELFTGNRLTYATLAYAWDGQLPVGKTVPYVRSKRLQNHIVETGNARIGQWLSYERNVVEDFKQIFGVSPPGIISSVGVLTDSDDLKNTAEGWYGDMAFSAERSNPS
jgi:hypothetical protein